MDRPQGLVARRIDAAEAAAALVGCESLDPRGLMTPADVEAMARKGQCFEIAGANACVVYVLTVRNGSVWVDAVKGIGDVDLTAVLDGVITAQASGMQAIALQTARRGLVKKLQHHGYRVTGWVMRKELMC